MERSKIAETILSPLQKFAAKYDIEYIECITLDTGNQTLFKKSINPEFPYLSYEVLEKNETFKNCDLNAVSHIELTSKFGVNIFCHIYPSIDESKTHYILILETKAPLAEAAGDFAAYISGVISGLKATASADSPSQNGAEKYKKELLNIRDIQSRLFPKFDEIKDLDIKSAYLPAELMSGTFIDGILLDQSTYQLTACDISENFPASSFIGAAIRTIIRSDAAQKKVPSAMIESVISKIRNMVSGATSS